MNFVYVLVSSEKDTYYEQTVISISSLRKNNPSAQIFLIVDQDTKNTLVGKRIVHNNYNVNIVSITLPPKMNNRDRSRFLKTSMNQYIKGNFMYIDGDTVICDSLEDFDTSIEIGMVLDGHTNFSKAYTYKPNLARCKKMKFSPGINDCYFNGGFMWVKDCENSRKFFSLWHELWKYSLKKFNIGLDQPALNETNYRLGGIITVVDGIWNCQVARRNPSTRFIYDAKILHYFATRKKNCFDLSDPLIQKTLLDAEHSELDKILNNPKAAFSDVIDMNIDMESLFIERTSTYTILRSIYHIKPLFFILDIFSKVILFVPKRILKYKKV